MGYIPIWDIPYMVFSKLFLYSKMSAPEMCSQRVSCVLFQLSLSFVLSLCLCLCLCLSVSLSLCLSVSLSVCLSLSLSLCLSLSLPLSLSLSVSLCEHLLYCSVHLCVPFPGLPCVDRRVGDLRRGEGQRHSQCQDSLHGFVCRQGNVLWTMASCHLLGTAFAKDFIISFLNLPRSTSTERFVRTASL